MSVHVSRTPASDRWAVYVLAGNPLDSYPTEAEARLWAQRWAWWLGLPLA